MNGRASPSSSATLSSCTNVIVLWSGSTSTYSVLSVIASFTNYKGYHSIIRMILVDTCYRFLWVEVGSDYSARVF
ncbi:hypothetical protein DPMN_007658 [Dreissena polymorpha]|uniref:Uncharacterized protein n=1 Tax=Dreissena polymorpha TaxID=45954 RepID=A0A9D4RWL7_DREPO|nr:hypothetical protein DPMN_007658 [Dreissena polymorpha]